MQMFDNLQYGVQEQYLECYDSLNIDIYYWIIVGILEKYNHMYLQDLDLIAHLFDGNVLNSG